MNFKKNYLCCLLAWVMIMAMPVAQAATILYVPQDDRPVSLKSAVDTAQTAQLTVLTPPAELIASRDKKGDADGLWQWVQDNAGQADALVLSVDALIYGGLVDSRVHSFSEGALQERFANFDQLRRQHPFTRLYVYGTVQRTPQGTTGGVEPSYYEQYGWSIFRLTALTDKQEVAGLTRKEKKELAAHTAQVPAAAMEDWLKRRQKNFQINAGLIELSRREAVDFFLLGRDDSAPYSQSKRETRQLSLLAADLPQSRFQTFPGADQLGMILLARAYNNLHFRIPIVGLQYAPGTGPDSIPSYEDQPVGKSIAAHIVAAGGIVLSNPQQPDFMMYVNTPLSGKTPEAGSVQNTTVLTPATSSFIDGLEHQLAAGRLVALADIAFANGADNALMAELSRRSLLDRLAAYAGWNTAGNSIGYAVGQAMLTEASSQQERRRLLAERYLDDWAYQANIRRALTEELVVANHGSAVYLNELKPQLTAELQKRERQFAEQHLWLAPEQVETVFPWNRMFEIEVAVAAEGALGSEN